MKLLKKIDLIIDFILKILNLDKTKEKDLRGKFRTKFLLDCMVAVAKHKDWKKVEGKKIETEDDLKEFFKKAKNELGEEELGKIFILQAELLVMDLLKIVSQADSKELKKDVLEFVKKTFQAEEKE